MSGMSREPSRAGKPDWEAASAPAMENADKSRLRSTEIFKGAREVVIEHEGEEYRLRRTSKGKLILTK